MAHILLWVKKKVLRRKSSCSYVCLIQLFATVTTTEICFGPLIFSLLISHTFLKKIGVQTRTMRMFGRSEAETNYFFWKIKNLVLQYFWKAEDYSFPVKR